MQLNDFKAKPGGGKKTRMLFGGFRMCLESTVRSFSDVQVVLGDKDLCLAAEGHGGNMKEFSRLNLVVRSA